MPRASRAAEPVMTGTPAAAAVATAIDRSLKARSMAKPGVVSPASTLVGQYWRKCSLQARPAVMTAFMSAIFRPSLVPNARVSAVI